VVKRFSGILVAGFLLMSASGCGENKSGEPGVVDYMTGAEQVRTYRKAKSQLEGVNKTLEKRYQEIDQ